MNEETKQEKFTEAEVREAQSQISKHVSAAYAELDKAKALADKYKLDFHFSPAYGMGGYYNGDPDERSEYSEDGWRPSSQSC